jgi:flagellar hook-basal body complex protein FliE
MIVTPIVPDIAPIAPSAASASPDPLAGGARAFAALLGSATRSLDAAARAETAFADGRGGLQEMVVARAHADIALQVAATAAARAAQAVQTLLGIAV